MTNNTARESEGTFVPGWTFGDKFRKARRISGLDQRDFAARLNLTASTVAAYEGDRAAPRLRDAGYFPGRSGGHAHLTTIWRHIRNLIDLNPHALRRRAGTTVYRGTGKDVRVAQSFLGHASIVTTQDYLEVEREDLLLAGAAARLAA